MYVSVYPTSVIHPARGDPGTAAGAGTAAASAAGVSRARSSGSSVRFVSFHDTAYARLESKAFFQNQWRMVGDTLTDTATLATRTLDCRVAAYYTLYARARTLLLSSLCAVAAHRHTSTLSENSLYHRRQARVSHHAAPRERKR